MSGAGNDFVVIDNRTSIIVDPVSFTIKACHRKFGIGADGVLLLETSKIADFTMKYYNADGSNAGMCGNGGRCLSKFAFDIGVVKNNVFNFDGFGHIYEATRIESEIFELKMKDPHNLKLDQTISIKNGEIRANYFNTGTDHSIIFLDDNPAIKSLNAVDVVGLGREIRYHDIYAPKGVNVNFVSRMETNRINIRTYERGVEDETLACGTGSVASALLSALKFGLESPIEVRVLSGENLTISFQKKDETFVNVKLKGSAKTTFTGEIDY